MQKTIGVLGGMGPYAALEFCRLILDNTKVKGDSDHFRVILDNNTKIPSRTRAIKYKEETPVKETVKAINNLSLAGADFVVLPCNSIHYWYEDISKEIIIPWINMMDVVAEKVKGKRTLVLGAHIVTELGLYNKKINAVYLDDKNVVHDAIYNIKKNGFLKDKNKSLLRAINAAYASYDIVLLACTEFSMMKKDLESINIPYVDSSLEYAKWVIKNATDE